MKYPIEKMRACLDLLPPPGGEVVAECLDEIESLRQQLAESDAEVAAWRSQAHRSQSDADRLEAECDQLRQQLAEANRKIEYEQLCASELEQQLDQLRQQLEIERIRLAACGVVALSNTPESAAKARDMLPEYRSASCDDVARAVDREMELRQQVTMLRDERDAAEEALTATADLNEFQNDVQAAAGGLSQIPL